MNAQQIFSKTMPFVWAKLLLGLVTIVASALLFALLMGIAWLFNSGGVGIIMFIVWLAATAVIRFVIMHYIGYLVKAGHIAVITEAVITGRIPENQVAYGKEKVKERFATSNVYFAVDKLITAAVKQIQHGIGKLGDALSFLPGMGALTGLVKYFIELSLGYVDECCLGYTFYKKEHDAFKSAADGVVIYAQNWKILLGNAAKTMAMVVLGLIVITFGLFLVLGILFRILSWPGWIAFIISIFIALAVKFAFIDSFILTRTMVTYMGVAPATEITYDLYSKLCNISQKFRELFDKGKTDESS